MLIFLLLFSLFSTSLAQDQVTPEVRDATPIGSFGQALAAAKLKYFQGDIAGASEDFELLRLRVSAGEKPPTSQFGEVLIYLGEIYYLDGRSDIAEGLFRELLLLDPEYPISPYEHPMEVVGIFEMLRRSYLRSTPEQPPPASDPQPLPVWGYGPFGISQFKQGKKSAGFIYASAQVVLGITSIATYLHLRQINEVAPPPSLSTERLQRRVRNERYFIQWPATLGFYALWGASVIDGQRSWKSEQPVSLNRSTGVHLALSYEF